MQAAFEKIIEKLEEEKMSYFLTIANTGDEKLDCAYEQVGNALDKAIEIVKQEAKKFGRDTNVGSNGWIPCSERMPEDEQVVLTCKYKSISILRYSTKTNHWYELSGNWWWSANMVTAWQPLPQPFQKGE